MEDGIDFENQLELSVCTPIQFEAVEEQRNLNSRENLHLLLISDDLNMLNFQIANLRAKGVNICQLPTAYTVDQLL
jgi:hypothetical protein